jgi:hypothetical protein
MKNQARAKAVKKIERSAEKAETERKAKAATKKAKALWYPS